MEDGPPSELALLLQSGFLVSRFTLRTLTSSSLFVYGAITLYGGSFQKPSSMSWFDNSPGCTLKQPHNPGLIAKSGLGSSLFARRY